MEQHKTLLIGVAVIAVTAFGAYWLVNSSFQDTAQEARVMETQNQPGSPEETMGQLVGEVVSGPDLTYTLNEVSLHSIQEDCWTVVNGNVYELTTFIAEHPGGVPQIMQLCGKDGTAVFEAQHGGSARQEAQLESLRIGALSE